MAIKSGVVSEIIQFKTKTGKFMYSLLLNGAKTRYGCKFTKPEVAVGDEVEFHFTETQNGEYTNYDVDVSTLRRKEKVAASKTAPEAVPTNSTPAKSVTYSTKGFDDPVRQVLIITQSARERAIEMLDLAIKVGIKLPVAKSGKVDDLAELVNIYTANFLVDTLKYVPEGHELHFFVKNLEAEDFPDIKDEDAVVEDAEDE